MSGQVRLTAGLGARSPTSNFAAQDPIMLGIITKLEDMLPDLAEAKLLIERHCAGIVLQNAKPNLISIASHRGR
jgi:hypothetical protein